MKKVILLILAILAIVSCEYKTEADREEAKRLNGFNIVVIDSCEYIIQNRASGYSYFAHKGNCRFCKERREKKKSYESK